MIRLIASDLDDTLLNANSDLNGRVIKALHAAMDVGCGIVLSSGRMMEAMLPLTSCTPLVSQMLYMNGSQKASRRNHLRSPRRMGSSFRMRSSAGMVTADARRSRKVRMMRTVM